MSILIRFFIKDFKNIKKPSVRASYGKLASIYGIFWNIILFVSKLVVGTLFGSVSITADAFNNLSDAGSSIISLVSFIFSSRPADEDHPFGHERLEYVFSLMVAFIIMFFGLQLIMNSVDQILHPTVMKFDLVVVIILLFSIIVKAYMYYYNRKYGKLINSTVMHSAAVDSISDVMATGVVLVGLIISHFFAIQLDGYLGVVVALFIMKGGYEIIVETFNKLIGEAPDPEFTKKIIKKILSYDGVLGVHDLVIHTYGPGKTFVTVHVEVDCDEDILKSHDIIDNIEKDFAKHDQINLVIHMDPIDMDDEFTNKMRIQVAKEISGIDEALSIHDFRVVRGDTHNNLIFDVDVPIGFPMKDKELLQIIHKNLPQGKIPNYGVITIDRAYTTTVEE
ncbi:cation diffusion facilitator family transporter [Breznakia sp. PF5-3]|uniref:cation diffusion facilitator family transporter n=1 Tax=unclassified Breznakia TaxID=2623764 RepID=UPI002405E9D2|nr:MULTISPECIES: cation diffusion facilitator family transporter [unclassified Breznakia]MDF9823654.1 cation diffusion facilitator family transporter [Breznakia sp. PM6-1]MDF9834452.1 cation diffusion facilitator family transporter [Breznakia sp. PF5-3]MDF9838609.1 cation diffusion facilitator family transporter [Breznakia sp. PFB2-8]MDF9860654.1 cation diffusion facilitator family transporter [Breznakia sp. PH5-24]